MSTWQDFSVFGNEFETVVENNITYLVKKIKLTTLQNHHLHLVYQYTLNYFSKFQEAAIPFPEVKKHSLNEEEKRIRLVCKYEGSNVMQLLQEKGSSSLFHEARPWLQQIMQIFKQAQNFLLYIDPHPKNFVVNEEQKVYYVDFSPPCVPEYMQLLLDQLPGEDRTIAEKNFECFHPRVLGYHFAADLLKENLGYQEIMKDLYDFFLRGGIISSGYPEFLQRAEEIKAIELERVRRKVFLI